MAKRGPFECADCEHKFRGREGRTIGLRIQKITAILWDAKQKGHDPAKVAAEAVESIGWGDTEKVRLTAAAIVRNLTILERLGGTTPEDLADMRRGRTAEVSQDPMAARNLLLGWGACGRR